MYPNTMPEPTSTNQPGYYGPQYGPLPPQLPRDAYVKPGLWQVPNAFWGALVVGAGAFFVHVSVQQTSVGSGGYSCSYTDFLGFVAAAVIGICVVAGWVSRATSHVNARLSLPIMSVLTAALLALGVVHALRGGGTIMSPCDSHPLP